MLVSSKVLLNVQGVFSGPPTRTASGGLGTPTVTPFAIANDAFGNVHIQPADAAIHLHCQRARCQLASARKIGNQGPFTLTRPGPHFHLSLLSLQDVYEGGIPTLA